MKTFSFKTTYFIVKTFFLTLPNKFKHLRITQDLYQMSWCTTLLIIYSHSISSFAIDLIKIARFEMIKYKLRVSLVADLICFLFFLIEEKFNIKFLYLETNFVKKLFRNIYKIFNYTIPVACMYGNYFIIFWVNILHSIRLLAPQS